MSSHPAPSGCVDYLEEVTGGYRIIRRCNGTGVRSMWYEFYAKGIHNTDWWSNQVIVCGAESGRTLTNNFYSYYTESVHRTIYCDGRIDDQYDILSRGYINEFGTNDPCVSPIRYYSNCKNLDSVLSAFIPVEKCFNPLRGAYESCAQNCRDPVYKTEIAEVCGDNIDNNCNGGRDEGCAQCVDGDSDGSFAYDAVYCPEGNDCDDNDASKNRRNEDRDEYSTCDGDCNDDPETGRDTYPGAKDKCDNVDNNCNGNIDEDCCEVQSVRVNPPWVWPKIPLTQGGAGGTTEAEVYVSLIRPAPPEGCTVDLSVEPVENSGGHKHDGDRPSGNIIPSSIGFSYGETEKDPEEPKPKYISSEVSGEEKIKATIAGGREGEAEIIVKVPNLSSMPISPYYRLTGQTPLHPDNHYGKDTTLSYTFLIGYDFYDQFKATLGINDMSLKSGGGFDIHGRWLTDITSPQCKEKGYGHCSHRKGTGVDIDQCAQPVPSDPSAVCEKSNGESVSGLKNVPRQEVERICKKRGGSLLREPTLHCEF